MRNWIRTAVICAVMAWCAEPVLAFEATTTSTAPDTLGRCVVEQQMNVGGITRVAVKHPKGSSAPVADSWYKLASPSLEKNAPRYLTEG